MARGGIEGFRKDPHRATEPLAVGGIAGRINPWPCKLRTVGPVCRSSQGGPPLAARRCCGPAPARQGIACSHPSTGAKGSSAGRLPAGIRACGRRPFPAPSRPIGNSSQCRRCQYRRPRPGARPRCRAGGLESQGAEAAGADWPAGTRPHSHRFEAIRPAPGFSFSGARPNGGPGQPRRHPEPSRLSTASPLAAEVQGAGRDRDGHNEERSPQRSPLQVDSAFLNHAAPLKWLWLSPGRAGHSPPRKLACGGSPLVPVDGTLHAALELLGSMQGKAGQLPQAAGMAIACRWMR